MLGSLSMHAWRAAWQAAPVRASLPAASPLLNISRHTQASPDGAQAVLCYSTAAPQQHRLGVEFPRVFDVPGISTSLPSPWRLLCEPAQHQQRHSSMGEQLQVQRLKHTVPYARRSGTSRPEPWPEFQAVDTSKTGSIKWQRALYRFPPAVSVLLEGRRLSLSGRAGTVTLDLLQLDRSGLVAFSLMQLAEKKAPTLALASPVKRCFDQLVDELDANVRGVSVGYLVGLTVKGVGYRIEPMDEQPRKRSWYFDDDKVDRSSIQYPHPTPVPAVRLKVGYSRTAVFPLPENIRAFCIKPTLLYLYGLRKEEVDATAAAIRSVRKPNVYTGNGIRLMDEQVRIKQRKATK